MKKNMRLLLAFAVVLVLCLACAGALAEVVNGLTIEVVDGVKTVTHAATGTSSVTVPEGVEAIADYAFSGNTDLYRITLPSTLETIGYQAFYQCTNLSSVTLPSYGLKEIGGYAFADCEWLSSLSFAYDLETIGDYAFANCKRISSVSLPYQLTTLGKGAFQNCVKLSSVSLSSSNLKTIGAYAFQGCKALWSFNYLLYVETIEEYAFQGCTSLTSVNFTKLKTIGSHAFEGCTALNSFVPSRSLEAIGTYAFQGCKALKSLTLYENVKNVGAYAFQGCAAMTSAALPAGLETLGSNAFAGTKIEHVNLPENLTVFDATVFSDDTILYVGRSSATAKLLARPAGYAHRSFIDRELPQYQLHYRKDGDAYSLIVDKYTGRYAQVVTIPDGVVGIGSQAFYGYDSSYNADHYLEELHLPDSVTELGSNAVIGYGELKHVYLPDNISSWGNYVFDSATGIAGNTNIPILHCSYGSATAYGISTNGSAVGFTDPADPTFSWHYESADSTNMKLVRYWGTEEELVLPENVTSVADRTFYGNKTLKKITLPEDLTYLGEYAFYECTALESMNVPKNITKLGRQTFYGCKALTDVTLPDGLTELGYEVFGDCTALREVVLPENITTVGESSFRFNGDVKLYVSRNSTTAKNLGYSSSNYAVPFVDPEWPDFKLFYLTTDTADEYRLGVGKYIGQNQKTVTVPDGVEIIGRQAFYGYDGKGGLDQVVEEIRLPDSVTELEDNAITGYEALERVYLPDNIAKWGSSAIADYMKPYAALYCTMGSVTAHGVSDYTSLPFVDVNQPDWGWRYDENDELLVAAYYGTDRHITLPEGGKGIANDAFNQDSTGPISVVIPEGYKTIGEYAFPSCLEYVSLPEGLTTIGEMAFANAKIRSVQLPSTLTTIEKDAFWDCNELQTLTIPKSVTSLPHSIAYGADDLHTVVIPREVTSIASDAFTGDVTQVYCYYNSAAYKWALDTARYPMLLDGLDFDELVTMGLERPEIWITDMWDSSVGKGATVADAGTTAFWRGRIGIDPMPLSGGYTAVCTSSDPSVAKVEGDFVTYLKPGTVTLTYSIKEIPGLKKTEKVTVYKPVEDFEIPSAMLIPLDDWRNVQKVTKVTPADANPYFSWTVAGEHEWYPFYYNGLKNLEIDAENKTGIRILKVRSVSGVTKAVKVIDYGTISDIRASAPERRLHRGEIYMPLIQVKVDNLYFAYEPALYTLTSSNNSVVRPTADGRLQAVNAGTATVTAKAVISGKTASFTVTVSSEAAFILPSKTLSIEANAFTGNAAKTIILPDGCTSIGERAFANSTKLEEIIIPASVTEIAEDAFEGCSGVKVIAPYGSEAQTFAEKTDGLTWQEGV